MVDGAIIMVDNAHHRLDEWIRNGSIGDRTQVLIDSAKEVGPSIFASLLVIAIAFMPIFTLEAQEGRLFKPLAWTKNLAIAMSAGLAITLIPALLAICVRGKIISEQRHPVSLGMQKVYAPVLRAALRFRWAVVILAVGLSLTVIPAFDRMVRSSCRRSTRGPSCICPRRCPESPSPRHRSYCSRWIAS
jgi:Cu(I)/Ag(I) efflux system membrane protein CusA/SilA